MRFVLFTLALASLLLLQGCPFGSKSDADNSTKDGLREIASLSHKIGNTVDKGRTGLRKLKDKGLVDTQEAREVTAALLDVSRITDTFTEQARKQQEFDGTAKAALDKWVSDLAAAHKKLIGDGSYHIRNPTAQAEFSAIVGTIATLIQTITQLAPTLKPTEKANDGKPTLGIGSETASRGADDRRLDRTEQLLFAARSGLVASG